MPVKCNKTAMCNVCGKVMRDDNLKRHLSLKHGNTKNSVKCKEERQQPSNLLIGSQHYSKVQAEGSEIDKSDDFLLNDGANLKFELQRDDEVYQKNVNIGEQISILLESENIREKSLSKRNKFCSDIFCAQQPTTDVKKIQSSDFGKNSLLTLLKRIQ